MSEPRKTNPNLKCPGCGSMGDYTVQAQGGPRDTYYICNKCKYTGVPKAWMSQQRDVSLVAGSVTDLPASDKSSLENDPTALNTRNNRKRYRTKPEEDRLTITNPRQMGSELVRGSKENNGDNKMIISSNNPFIKKAREFRRSPWGQFMKEDSEKNMVFDEGRQGVHDFPSSGKKTKDEKIGADDKINSNNKPLTNGDDHNSDIPDKDSAYDTVDRKEYRSSPKPEMFMPGYREWMDRQVDKFYDGWVEHHIENSGGKIVGSNTEKTMNLNDGERSHPPVHPVESITEKLLESRHQFNDDYSKTTIAAVIDNHIYTKASMESIKKVSNVEESNDEITVADLVDLGASPENSEKVLSMMENGDDPKEVIAFFNNVKNLNKTASLENKSELCYDEKEDEYFIGEGSDTNEITNDDTISIKVVDQKTSGLMATSRGYMTKEAFLSSLDDMVISKESLKNIFSQIDKKKSMKMGNTFLFHTVPTIRTRE